MGSMDIRLGSCRRAVGLKVNADFIASKFVGWMLIFAGHSPESTHAEADDRSSNASWASQDYNQVLQPLQLRR